MVDQPLHLVELMGLIWTGNALTTEWTVMMHGAQPLLMKWTNRNLLCYGFSKIEFILYPLRNLILCSKLQTQKSCENVTHFKFVIDSI